MTTVAFYQAEALLPPLPLPHSWLLVLSFSWFWTRKKNKEQRILFTCTWPVSMFGMNYYNLRADISGSELVWGENVPGFQCCICPPFTCLPWLVSFWYRASSEDKNMNQPWSPEVARKYQNRWVGQMEIGAPASTVVSRLFQGSLHPKFQDAQSDHPPAFSNLSGSLVPLPDSWLSYPPILHPGLQRGACSRN